jgi:hypothetical protein
MTRRQRLEFAGIWVLGVSLWLLAISDGPMVKAQTSEPGLRVHRELRPAYMHIQAICDEANGVMVYVALTNGTPALGVSAVPNGCKKVEAGR